MAKGYQPTTGSEAPSNPPNQGIGGSGFAAKWNALTLEELQQRMWPVGTEDACCFVCQHSSTNPELIATAPELFQPKARYHHGLLQCRRFNSGYLVFGFNWCGEFAHRGEPRDG